jgi:Ca2+-binding EF-hand superfamily protein
MHYRLGLLLLSVGLCVGLVVVTSPLRARISSASILRMLDKDNDGTVDMAEAKNAGTLLFEQLDSNKDGTLDADELRGRVTKQEIEATNPNNKDTLTKDDYLKLVEARFNAADSNHDGKLDIQELSSLPGDAVVRLLVHRILV